MIHGAQYSKAGCGDTRAVNDWEAVCYAVPVAVSCDPRRPRFSTMFNDVGPRDPSPKDLIMYLLMNVTRRQMIITYLVYLCKIDQYLAR